MLAKRIIPTLLVRGGSLVKGKRFQSWRSVGSPLSAARLHASRGVDELMIFDIQATKLGRVADLGMVRALSETVFVPITVGGGVATEHDVEQLLAHGADKVAVCSAAIDWRLPLIERLARRFGSQAIVAVVEYRRSKTVGNVCTFECAKYERAQGPIELAMRYQSEGAGEIVFNSVDRDGTMEGLDLALLRSYARNFTVPIVISGGCSGYEDMRLAIEAGADAVAAGALFQFTDCTPAGAAEYLAQHGVEVRLNHALGNAT